MLQINEISSLPHVCRMTMLYGYELYKCGHVFCVCQVKEMCLDLN